MTKVPPPEAEAHLWHAGRAAPIAGIGQAKDCAPVHDEVLPGKAAALAEYVALQAMRADDTRKPNLWEHYLRGTETAAVSPRHTHD